MFVEGCVALGTSSFGLVVAGGLCGFLGGGTSPIGAETSKHGCDKIFCCHFVVGMCRREEMRTCPQACCRPHACLILREGCLESVASLCSLHGSGQQALLLIRGSEDGASPVVINGPWCHRVDVCGGGAELFL